MEDDAIRTRGKRQLLLNTIPFLVLFLTFLVRTLVKEGFAVNPETGNIYMEPYKYLTNFIDMWYLVIVLLVGVVLLLFAIVKTLLCKKYIYGIWFAGTGVVLVVFALLLNVGWNNTAY